MTANSECLKSHPAARTWNREYSRQWYLQNREQKQAQARLWEQRNAVWRPEYLRRKAREWHHKHSERSRANTSRYYLENQGRKNSRRNELFKVARANDPGTRILLNFRSRLSTLIHQGGIKTFSISKDILLYPGAELCAHLEKQFTPKMSWANYGKFWEVDHIKECAWFDLADLRQCRECFELQNLRPLEITANRSRYHAERRKAKSALPNANPSIAKA